MKMGLTSHICFADPISCITSRPKMYVLQLQILETGWDWTCDVMWQSFAMCMLGLMCRSWLYIETIHDKFKYSPTEPEGQSCMATLSKMNKHNQQS